MRYVLMLGVALALVGGCGGDAPPGQGTADSHVAAVQAPVAAAAPTAKPVPSAPAVVAPPVGAQWTIYCRSFTDPDHVESANQAKAVLLIQSRMSAWHIVHQADQSILYYGYYKDLHDAQARADKRAMDGLVDSSGLKRFNTCMFVPMETPDPTAPPEWNLLNTPPNMFWSLQIAAFRGIPDRKERAVAAVSKAREMGVEAYYFHGETISSVCIGAWPKAAVRQQDGGDNAHTTNPDTPYIVLNEPLPEGAIPPRDENGNPIPIFAPKLTIDDPTLQKAINAYPDHAINGWVAQSKDVNGKLIPAPSFLVEIPHREALLGSNDPDAAPAPQLITPPTPPANPQDDSLGKLRTIGDH